MVVILIIVPVVISSNPAVDEGRKRVLGIMAAILASLHLWLRELECTSAPTRENLSSISVCLTRIHRPSQHPDP